MNVKKQKITRVGPLYSIVECSQEKKWGYFETGLYALVMLAAIVAIIQFSLQPDSLPLRSLAGPITPV